MNILMISSLESFLELVGALIIFAFVLLITFLTTRWIGGYQQTFTSNKNLRLIESIRVGNNKMISIVAAGDKFLVVAIGKDEITLLTELSEEQLKDASELLKVQKQNQESFQEIFTKIKEKLPKKQD